MLIIKEILLSAWVLPKQPLNRKYLFQGDEVSVYCLSEICRNLTTGLTSARVNRLSKHNLPGTPAGTQTPAVSGQSPLATPNSPFP